MNDGSLRSLRDRALLLVGFAAALRRSEIVALDVRDLDLGRDARGVTLLIRRSKTDQEQQGEAIAIPIAEEEALCPVQALYAWLEAAQISEGPVFRSFALPRGRTRSEVVQKNRLTGQDVARILRRVLKAADIDGDFAGHSLRAGFITSAAVRGVSEASIQRVSRHRSTAVLRGYVRHATRFDDAPFAEILQKRQARK
jgi:integrase